MNYIFYKMLFIVFFSNDIYMSFIKYKNEKFSEILENLGKSWKILENLGKSWKILENLGKSWKILENLGKFWKILENL